jgi:hypothetical protein
MSRLHLAGLAACACVLGTVAVAGAVTQQTYSQSLSKSKPKTPASTQVVINQSESETSRPLPLSRIELAWPSGSVIDTGAAAFCKKPTACPPKSEVGAGGLTIPPRSSDDDPIDAGVTVFNRKGGLYLSVELDERTEPFRTVFLATWSGKRSRHPSDKQGVKNVYTSPKLTILPEPICYSPGTFNATTQQCETNGEKTREAAFESLNFTAFRPVNKAPRKYLTTPGKCTPSKGWTFVGTFTNRGSTAPPSKLTSKAPCFTK